MTIPPCFNRPPRAAGRWQQVGRRPDGRPVLRWRPCWFEDRCATWDCPPDATPSPVIAGWVCAGCRWLPPAAIRHGLVPAALTDQRRYTARRRGDDRTPGHYLLTNEKFANLNGDALTAAEVPLATKCENTQVHYGPAAKETAALLALARGKKGLAQAIRNSDSRKFAQWKDAAMHAIPQISDAATKDRAVGMSLRTVLERRYGFTEPEIEQEMARIQAEAMDPVTSELLAKVRVGADGGA